MNAEAEDRINAYGSALPPIFNPIYSRPELVGLQLLNLCGKTWKMCVSVLILQYLQLLVQCV